MIRLRSFLIVALASSSLPLVACGGRVDGYVVNPDGGPAPECPQPETIAQGAACTSAGLSCAGPTTETCCGTDTTQCACEEGRWSCVGMGPTCECPAPPTCPSPNAVVPGGSCALPATLACVGLLSQCGGPETPSDSCSCQNGSWACTPLEEPDCGVVEEPPPPPCPSPDQTFANQVCSSPQLQCGGDPTFCDGTIFYDALQCTWDGSAWRWSILAQTICGDGGPPIQDAYAPDAQWGDE